MSNPVIDAFFLGRALAEVLGEKLEETYTNAISEIGKFDAEARENLRQFIEEVESRAASASTTTTNTTVNSNPSPSNDTPTYEEVQYSDDLQEMLDQLRAEIATLRSELKKYRDR